MGDTRTDLTARDFWPVRSYLVILQSGTPVRIVPVIHLKRDVAKLLN